MNLDAICVFLVGLQLVQAKPTTTTAEPEQDSHAHQSRGAHVPREHSEKDSIRFSYEPHSHQMVVAWDDACYIFALTDSEIFAVHYDVGFTTLESHLMNVLATEDTSPLSLAAETKQIQHGCGHAARHAYRVRHGPQLSQ